MYMRRLPCCRLKSCCCAPLQSLRSQRRKRRRKAVTWTISCSFSCAVCNRDQALEQSRQITSPVSLTNPHAGTWPSRKDPFLSRKAQIRPNSGLVAALYLRERSALDAFSKAVSAYLPTLPTALSTARASELQSISMLFAQSYRVWSSRTTIQVNARMRLVSTGTERSCPQPADFSEHLGDLSSCLPSHFRNRSKSPSSSSSITNLHDKDRR